MNNVWVSVQDRLPKKNKTVLVMCKNKSTSAYVYAIASHANGYWFVQSEELGIQTMYFGQWGIVAWTELPEMRFDYE